MMKYIKVAGFLSLLLCALHGCKKDKDNVPCLSCDKCENFPKPGGGISTIKQKELQKKAPCFNPNNANEFIYIKEEGNKQTLVKYNLATNQESILLENAQIVGQPKWGKNGKIVFIKTDYQVYLLQDNGQALTKITNGDTYLYPDWKNDTTIATEFSFNLGVPYFYCELDVAGTIKDTIRGSSHTFGASNTIESACLLYGSDPNINIRIGGNLIRSLSSFGNNGRNTITGIFWHPNNEDIFYSTYREGLYKVNKTSKQISRIRTGCDSRSYRYLSISPDGQKILVERVDATDFQNTTGSWTEEAKIYLMDIDGKNEKNVFE